MVEGARLRRRQLRRGRARAPHRVLRAQAHPREGRRPLGTEEARRGRRTSRRPRATATRTSRPRAGSTRTRARSTCRRSPASSTSRAGRRWTSRSSWTRSRRPTTGRRPRRAPDRRRCKPPRVGTFVSASRHVRQRESARSSARVPGRGGSPCAPRRSFPTLVAAGDRRVRPAPTGSARPGPAAHTPVHPARRPCPSPRRARCPHRRIRCLRRRDPSRFRPARRSRFRTGARPATDEDQVRGRGAGYAAGHAEVDCSAARPQVPRGPPRSTPSPTSTCGACPARELDAGEDRRTHRGADGRTLSSDGPDSDAEQNRRSGSERCSASRRGWRRARSTDSCARTSAVAWRSRCSRPAQGSPPTSGASRRWRRWEWTTRGAGRRRRGCPTCFRTWPSAPSRPRSTSA